MRSPVHRYSMVAITLHWVMAIAFLLMFASGLAMEYLELERAFKFKLYQWHKSLGVLLLVAFALRIIWRITHKPPRLPISIKGFELFAAKAGHWVLYLLMFALPMSGWLMVSSSSYGLPTMVFGWFEWPHFPGVAGDKPVHDASGEAHWIIALIFGIAILGHVAAVIRHAIQGDNLLPRMGLPGGKK